MEKPLVIISACQFTRLALESPIPTDRYVMWVCNNVIIEVEFVLKTSCGCLLADIPPLPLGESVPLAYLARLRNDAGQWQVCLTGDSDRFNSVPAVSLYSSFPRIGIMLTTSRYQNQIIRWLLCPLSDDMNDLWLLAAQELSMLKILIQGTSSSEIVRYERRSSRILHMITTRALVKFGLGTLGDFRLLYVGRGDSRVKRNVQPRAEYIGQHFAHRLTQYAQNMVPRILYPEKAAADGSINSDTTSRKVFSGQRRDISKKRLGLLWHSSVVTTAHCDTYGLTTVQEPKYFYCSGLQDWEAHCTACIVCQRTNICEGRMHLVFFCPSGIIPAQFAALSTGSVDSITCIRTEEESCNKLRYRPQSVVISVGQPTEYVGMWFRPYRGHSFVVVLCITPFFLPPDVSISGVPKNLRLLKPGMSVERITSIANASGGFSGLKHAEILPAMDGYSVFMKEASNRTKTTVMSERFPGRQRRVLSLLLAEHSREYSTQFLRTGVRQIWLAEQSLRRRWGISDGISLWGALLLSSNNFRGDGNALETTSVMTLYENGDTNRHSVVANTGAQALSLHKYK